MSEKPSQNSERRRPMNAVAEASTLMRVLAEPAQAGEGVKAAIRRAALRAGVNTGLGKRLWYGEARRIDSDIMDRLRHAAGDTQQLEEALAARRSLLARLAACEAALGLHDPHETSEVDHDASGRACDPHRALAGRERLNGEATARSASWRGARG